MNDKTLVILGAGGHAKVCYEIAIEMNQWEDIIILDDNPYNDFFNITNNLSKMDDYSYADFFVGIGDNNLRKNLLVKLFKKEYSVVTLIHSKAIISHSANIGLGSVIMAGVVINTNSYIGTGCILNTSTTVDHDSHISDYVHISPGVNIAGNVVIGKEVWVGIGSVLINNLKIVNKSIIGAGSLVLNDITDSGIYYGVPARRQIDEDSTDNKNK